MIITIIMYLVIALVVSVVVKMVGEEVSSESAAIMGLGWIFMVPFVFLMWGTDIIFNFIKLLKDNEDEKT